MTEEVKEVASDDLDIGDKLDDLLKG